ncbi:ATP-binding cassette domain-containing protein [Exiguobacterium sp. s6]|uniref:ATP-binding cassette domain-containing protein n=1 Tax=Exiguobacterium sp. s6 TaxID=2751236 RepID=UPI0005144FCF|nr:ATP-binding cassette domain-containing protein [Exiguobacterium sp. s6]KGI86365.1 hypothetical protein JY98_09025 [Exiguobacterium mexicanum]
MNTAISIKDLVVERPSKKILDFIGQEIEIPSGSVVAVLGENGAGKTTLIEALLGEIPFDGSVTPQIHPTEVGIVFQKNMYNDMLKVYELIELVTNYKRRDEAYSRLIHSYELEWLADRYIKDLSGGEAQRLTLALTSTRNNSYYIFDEITSGLDFKKREKLLANIKEFTRGKTVLHVTHYFEELVDWATHLLILKDGKIRFFGVVSVFEDVYSHHSIIKIMDGKREFLDSIELETIKMEDSLGLIIESHNQESDWLRKVQQQNLDFTILKQNLYTSFLLCSERTN